MKFDRSNKFDLCYYGQVNSLRVKSNVASNGQVNTFGGNIYFAGDFTYQLLSNLLFIDCEFNRKSLVLPLYYMRKIFK